MIAPVLGSRRVRLKISLKPERPLGFKSGFDGAKLAPPNFQVKMSGLGAAYPTSKFEVARCNNHGLCISCRSLIEHVGSGSQSFSAKLRGSSLGAFPQVNSKIYCIPPPVSSCCCCTIERRVVETPKVRRKSGFAFAISAPRSLWEPPLAFTQVMDTM